MNCIRMERDSRSPPWRWAALLLLLLATVTRIYSDDCPSTVPECICTTVGISHYITCENVGSWSEVPPFNPSNVTYEELSIRLNSTVQTIQNDSFKDLLLVSLKLESLGIQSVEDRAFGGLDTVLESLHLGGNMLTGLPQDALHNLLELKMVDISTNSIGQFDDDTFSQMPKLETLRLADNNLVQFPGLQAVASTLETLDLKGNAISELPEKAVANLTKLASLDVSLNPLHCDCNMEWLRGYEALAAITMTVCAIPEGHHDLLAVCFPNGDCPKQTVPANTSIQLC